jgi:hypothetical protein
MGSVNGDNSDKTVTVLITGFAVSCPRVPSNPALGESLAHTSHNPSPTSPSPINQLPYIN